MRHLTEDILLQVASTYFSRQQYDLVLLYCSQCLELDSLNESAYHKRAQVFAILGNLSEAKADLEVALRLKPNDATLLEDLKKVI